MGLHPKVVDALSATITECKARGIIVGMQSGLRSVTEQTHLYALGRTITNSDGASIKKPFGDIVTNAGPWSSWHSFGLAVDICPRNSRGEFFWWKDDDPQWNELAKVAQMFGFEWGGSWATFKGDMDHFQMRGKIPSVHEAKRILFDQGIEAVWALV